MSPAKENHQKEVVACTSTVNKRLKIYDVPRRDEFEFEITIKILQTSRQHKNKLTLSRDVVDTIIGKVDNFEFLKDNTNVMSSEEDNCDNEYHVRAIALLNILCFYVLRMYERVSNTNTSGIWDVSKDEIQ